MVNKERQAEFAKELQELVDRYDLRNDSAHIITTCAAMITSTIITVYCAACDLPFERAEGALDAIKKDMDDMLKSCNEKWLAAKSAFEARAKAKSN